MSEQDFEEKERKEYGKGEEKVGKETHDPEAEMEGKE
jgi:uncharacterized protein YjbJ (UPF0337 family)